MPGTSPDIKPFPLAITRAGIIFLGLSAFIYVAAINSGVNLLYLLFGMCAGVLVVSLVLASLTLRGISIHRDFGEHIVAGEPTDIEYLFTNTKRFWPTMVLHFREIHPDLLDAPGGFILHLPTSSRQMPTLPARISTRLIARRRGMVKLSAIEVSTTFPFGFLRRTRRLPFPQEMIIYPRIGMLNRHLALQYRESIESGTMTSNRRGGNDEFYGVREYRPGDNIRAIHWRSTARTGQLMIREMAANAPPQLIVVLNLRSWRHDPEPGRTPAAERAIELAAALLCYGFYENFAVALAIAGLPDQPPPAPQMGRDARARMLRQLAVLDPSRIEETAFDFPNRLAGRAEWVIITLHGTDQTRDLLPPGANAQAAALGAAANTHRTLLSLDAPDANSWVHFLSAQDALRLLRDRSAP